MGNMRKINPQLLEIRFKGIANHRRIQILILIAEREGVTLDGIVMTLDCNLKTIAEHTKRLSDAQLIEKRYQGRNVVHHLSPSGKILYQFIKNF